MLIWLWYPTPVVVGYLFLCIFRTSQSFTQTKLLLRLNFLKHVYVSLSYTYWDILQAKFEKRKDML